MAVPDDVTLSPAFAAVASTGLDATSLVAVGGGPPRVPRLEVPIDVQALRVAHGDTVEHADVATTAILDAATRPLDETDPDAVHAPPPFTELDAREPGVYVHWAMPDALLRADVVTEDVSDVQPGGEAVFPPLPNRWCLTRFWWHKTGYTTRSWVVEADRGRVTALEDWEEVETLPEDATAATPEVAPGDLTAVLGGDAAWSAVYDNVVHRFALYDDLADLVSEPPSVVHYAVVGWYSDAAHDPIAGTARIGGFDERLAELAWTADTSSLQATTTTFDRLEVQTNDLAALAGQGPTGQPGIDDLSSAQQISPTVLHGADRVIPVPTVYWPQQSLYHGTVYNVAVDEGGSDPKPSGGDVEVGLGGTTSDALSSLMAESLEEVEEAAREQLLNALQYGLIAELETPDGPPRLATEAHRRTFESRPGGFTTERIRAGDPFAHLRTPVPGEPRVPPYVRDVTRTQAAFADRGVAFEMVEADPDATATIHDRFQPRTGVAPDIVTRGTVAGSGSGPGGAFLPPPAEAIGPEGSREAGLGPEAVRPPDVIDVAPTVDPARGVADVFTAADRPLASPRSAQGIEFRTVKRALPRLFVPQDPAVALRGGGRSLRYRNATVFDEEGRLVCRLSGTAQTEDPGIVSGRDLLDQSLFVAHIPVEAQELLEEAVRNVLGGVSNILTVIDTTPGLAEAAAAGDALEIRLVAEDRLFERYLAHGATTADLLVESTRQGTVPSAQAITAWQQPWEPTYLEWELEITLDRDASHWSLDDLDIRPTATLTPDHTTMLAGRSLLFTSGDAQIADLLAAFIDEEENRGDDDRVVSDEALDDLRELNAAAGLTDVLSASLDGVRDHLLGFSTNVRLTEADSDGEILPDRLPELLRAGAATVRRLRLVDAFGRFVDLEPPFSVSDEIEVPDAAGDELVEAPDTFLLPPRILAPSRLWFRFVDVTDDTRDALLDQETQTLVRSPIAAWLLPDHVDGALEVFDAAGEPLGQLRNERLGAGVVWEGAPGHPGPMGRPPFADIPDRHAAEFARALVERDAAERQAGLTHGESTLDAFLRTVDTTMWTVDPYADSGLDYYAKMTGRPIAMVRARLLLDVLSDDGLFAADDPRHAERRGRYDELSRRRFEVRLGSLAQIDDGLLGYFVGDDYRRFHPVHASVPLQAVPSGPNTGFLASHAVVPAFDPTTEVRPITHPYVVADPKVNVQVGHPVWLTLLLDPGTRVHATCGLVPRKAVGLPRGFVEGALARIAPSFRFGPLLVDPAVIRAPKPSVLPTEQVWTRRDTPVSWRDDPIEAATQFAHLPDTSHEAQEGYVRVRLDP